MNFNYPRADTIIGAYIEITLPPVGAQFEEARGFYEPIKINISFDDARVAR